MKVNKTIVLNNGIEMPVIGLGVWAMPDGKTTERAVKWAIDAGYRHIDTAKIYDNESEVGKAIRECGVPREEIFITTKLWNDDHGFRKAIAAIDASLNRLNMDYVDLYLIHWPFEGWGSSKIENEKTRAETWKAMEEIHRSGKVKAIGVANYSIQHLEEIKSFCEINPAVNQVEFHPFWFRNELMDYCHQNKIAVTDYSPLVRGRKLFDNRITDIAANYSKSNAQVLIRWGLQHGNSVIPKSAHQERIIENIDVFDFEISESDMAKLDALNENFAVVKS